MKWILIFITLSAEGDPVTSSLGSFDTQSECEVAAYTHSMRAPIWVGKGLYANPKDDPKIARIFTCQPEEK